MKMINADQINTILGIDESYKAPTAIMKLLFDKKRREKAFRSFLEIEHDLTRDAFHAYFEEQQANKRKYAQDFTPDSISNLLTKIVPTNGKTLDVATGSGALIIAKWHEDRMKCGIADYRPSKFLYHCEELSDNALPFLLFNLMIRGMNATVVHGDSIARKAKQVYLIANENDDFMDFSTLNIFPHSKDVEEAFNVGEWLEEEKTRIELKEAWLL